jgi:hypothetical protein
METATIQERVVLSAPATPEGFAALTDFWLAHCPKMELYTVYTYTKQGVWYVSATLVDKKGGEANATPDGS